MIKNKKVLLVEDEFSIALDIKTSLEKLDYLVVGIADCYDYTMKYVSETNPDIIVMDVNISGDKNGIETAEAIYKKYKIPVVFLTAYGDEHTFAEALQSKPFGFLLKPFKIKELSFALQIALQKQVEKPTIPEPPSVTTKVYDTLFIKDKSQLTKVKIDEILWVEAMDNYTQIITKDKKVVVNMFLKEFYEKVPQDKFLRIHRSYIIALDKIEKIENRFICIGNQNIPISKAYKNQLLERLDIL